MSRQTPHLLCRPHNFTARAIDSRPAPRRHHLCSSLRPSPTPPLLRSAPLRLALASPARPRRAAAPRPCSLARPLSLHAHPPRAPHPPRCPPPPSPPRHTPFFPGLPFSTSLPLFEAVLSFGLLSFGHGPDHGPPPGPVLPSAPALGPALSRPGPARYLHDDGGQPGPLRRHRRLHPPLPCPPPQPPAHPAAAESRPHDPAAPPTPTRRPGA